MRWRVLLVAVVRTVVATSPIWVAMLLDRFGHHMAATGVLWAGCGWWARIVWDDYTTFRRAYLRWRRSRP